MTCTTAAIRPLPDDIAAQIKSSTTISSLEHAVIELLKNSLDASCHKVEIGVDFGRGTCIVEDDGLGIKPEEFLDTGGLGKAYHTSKLENTYNLYGGEGTFLASLAAVSILAITSHHHAYRSSATLIYHHTRPVARFVPAPLHYHLSSREHGTKVDVHDLFGNMPVRVKQRGLIWAHGKEHLREWETIHRSIVGILLAWHSPVTVILRDLAIDRKLIIKSKTPKCIEKTEGLPTQRALDLDYICSVLSQGGCIEHDIRDTWIKTSARTSFITIRGAFSLQPVPSKRTQFISLGIRYLPPDAGASVLYDEVNRAFAHSSFGTSEDLSDEDNVATQKKQGGRYKRDGTTNKKLRGIRKGVDRWPMFVVRIELGEQVSVNGLGGRDVLERESTVSIIVKVLGAMTTGFLNDYHFRPHARRKRRHPDSFQNTPYATDRAQTGERASASPISIATPVSRCSSNSHTAETVQIAKSGDDVFSCSIQLPKIQVDRGHYNEAFSGWSRIKSGTNRGIEDGILDTKTNTQSSRIVPHSTAVTTAPEEHLQDDPSALVAEGTFTWIDPLTKAHVLLDARTGQIVSTVVKRSPASNTDQTLDNGVLQPIKRMTVIDRLPRCTSPTNAPKAGSWVSGFLKEWNNPVFSPPTEQAVHQMSFEGPTLEISHGGHRGCAHRDIEKAFTEASITTHLAKLSKAGLMKAKVISQVDKKFILVLTDPVPQGDHGSSVISSEHQILILVDQHAADERIRIEALLTELCIPPSAENLGLNPSTGITTSLLPKPIAFQIKSQEHRLFTIHAHHFARWGILYEPSGPANPTLDTTTRITVKSLPPVIAERCRLEPKLLIELLRKEIWKLEEDGRGTGTTTPLSPTSRPSDVDLSNATPSHWLTRLTTCPQGIIDMLNSRACRSAIMFNDELTHTECETLVRRLAECAFPFQCAHGRPSMVPLVTVGQANGGVGGGLGAWEEEEGFEGAWRGWRGGLMGGDGDGDRRG
ncbi:MAG: hypothetical protein Q9209_003990 [Squamulea sp. 1 TL-2023]